MTRLHETSSRSIRGAAKATWLPVCRESMQKLPCGLALTSDYAGDPAS